MIHTLLKQLDCCVFEKLSWVVLLLIFAAYPAEAVEPAGYVGKNTKWKTPFYVLEGKKSGPVVLITGGVHGNEPAGAVAAGLIARQMEVQRGQLVVIPRCNKPGLNTDKRGLPGEPKKKRDLNRNFPVNGKRKQPRGTPAKQIWRLVKRVKPDYMLDLHEGYGIRGAGSDSVGSSVLRKRGQDTKPLQKVMLSAVNNVIHNENKTFVPLVSIAEGALSRACAEQFGSKAFILETTYKNQPLEVRINQHLVMVQAFVRHIGMIRSR